MPVFSFTAPHITPEEEKRERESLTDEIRKQLERDLYGDDDDDGVGIDDNGGSGVDSKWLQEMETIIGQTPKSRKKDYLDAKERVPELIETEANPIQFLRCEKFDVSVRRIYGVAFRCPMNELFNERVGKIRGLFRSMTEH
jgi:hypothetical protein